MHTTAGTSTGLMRGGRWPARPLLTATLAAALVAWGPTAARAQSISSPEPTGDMVGVEYETNNEVPAPDHVRNDVIATRLGHSATMLSIRVQYVEMVRAGEINALWVQMVTDEGARRNLELLAGRGDWAGRATMHRGHDRPVPCAIRHTMDYARNVVAVSFPRRCAGSPRWVKFRVLAWTLEDDGFFYFDDVAQSGRVRRPASG